MTYPATYSAWRRSQGIRGSEEHPLTLNFTHDEKLPQLQDLGHKDVVIKIHAVSLNYRELTMLTGGYPFDVEDGGYPCSDAAAEVVAIGKAVTCFAVGDSVTPVPCTEDSPPNGNWGPVNTGVGMPGVLREYAVYKEAHLVALPKHLSWEEGSTLACAGLTAWNALEGFKDIPENAVALLQGTGGVSMMGLTFCLAAGVRVIITSSSDEKLESIKKISPAIQGINYRTTKSLARDVMRLTGGSGVNYVVNNAGFGGLIEDVDSLADYGTISLVGAVSGRKASWEHSELAKLMMKRAKIRGILMGTRNDFEEMNRFIEEKHVRLNVTLNGAPFSFDQAKDAYALLRSGNFCGKIVIKVTP